MLTIEMNTKYYVLNCHVTNHVFENNYIEKKVKSENLLFLMLYY